MRYDRIGAADAGLCIHDAYLPEPTPDRAIRSRLRDHQAAKAPAPVRPERTAWARPRRTTPPPRTAAQHAAAAVRDYEAAMTNIFGRSA